MSHKYGICPLPSCCTGCRGKRGKKNLLSEPELDEVPPLLPPEPVFDTTIVVVEPWLC